MSRFLLLLPLLLAAPAFSQEAGKIKRTIYDVRHSSAKNLAEMLNKHFKDEADFQAVPEPTSNALLLSGSPAVLTEVQTVLGRLDRAPRQVALEIWIAEMGPPGKGEEVDAKTLEGTLEEVRARLEQLHHKGHITTLRRFELKASENQPALVTNSEQKTFVTGSSSGFGGKGGAGGKTLSMAVRAIGTKLTATARIPPDRDITLELNLEDSRPHVAADAPVLGLDDTGNPIRATDIVTSSVETKLNLRSGHAAPLQGMVSRSKAGTAQMLIVVGTRLIEETGAKGK